jgi:hypothetical protein
MGPPPSGVNAEPHLKVRIYNTCKSRQIARITPDRPRSALIAAVP